MEKRKARGTWNWAFLKSLLLRSFHEQALWFLISFLPYYALNGISVHPENNLSSLRHLTHVSITLKPAPRYTPIFEHGGCGFT